jgi:hypothetical protein
VSPISTDEIVRWASEAVRDDPSNSNKGDANHSDCHCAKIDPVPVCTPASRA